MLLKKLARIFDRGSKKPEDEVLRRNNQVFERINLDLELSEYEFVVLDTELTGFDVSKDEILSIGAVKIRNLCISAHENFYVIVKPESGEVKKDSTIIHRLTPQLLENAPYLRDVMREFVEFCCGAVLVGHFIELDLSFLNKALRNILNGTLRNIYVDTLRLSMNYKTRGKGFFEPALSADGAYSLEELSKEFNLPLLKSHDALEDSFQTAYLFLFLVKKMQSKGIKTLNDLLVLTRNSIGV